jgi:(p)ppGpp synthase/HD superfamily hydrolase
MRVRSLIDRAKTYAIEAHRRIDHRRKYTCLPYEMHLKAVAELVTSVTDDPVTIAAAWLHDTVEDTPVTIEEVEDQFGAEVAALVADMTDISRSIDGNRAARKEVAALFRTRDRVCISV